jgi:hypothetical protein
MSPAQFKKYLLSKDPIIIDQTDVKFFKKSGQEKAVKRPRVYMDTYKLDALNNGFHKFNG